MSLPEPSARLDPRFSDPDARPTPWPRVREQLRDAPLYWLSTVRPDGRPHTTPLIGVWVADALHVCTGAGEQKARNLAANPAVTITTGTAALDTGTDVVVEGTAVLLTRDGELRDVAAEYLRKYGPDWQFDVRDGAFHHEHSSPLVYRITAGAVFAFAKGTSGQTRFEWNGSAR